MWSGRFSMILKTEKSQKFTTKEITQKNEENMVFVTPNKKYPRKSLFLEYFKVKIHIETC